MRAWYLIPGIQGYGIVNSPYQIDNLSKLNKIANWVNKTGDWDSTWTSTGRYFKLATDIVGFTSTIGTAGAPFIGTLDGAGHRIDININKPNNSYVGLFGKAENAVIKNLTVTGSVIGKSYVGGIVGYATGGEIEHCTNVANVTAKAMTSTTDPPGGGQVGSDDPLGGFSTYVVQSILLNSEAVIMLAV